MFNWNAIDNVNKKEKEEGKKHIEEEKFSLGRNVRMFALSIITFLSTVILFRSTLKSC